jgi:hypothetical protein
MTKTPDCANRRLRSVFLAEVFLSLIVCPLNPRLYKQLDWVQSLGAFGTHSFRLCSEF